MLSLQPGFQCHERGSLLNYITMVTYAANLMRLSSGFRLKPAIKSADLLPTPFNAADTAAIRTPIRKLVTLLSYLQLF